MNDFKNKFLVDQFTIFESEKWIWSLRPQQATIGSGVLSLKRLCHNFSDLTPDEFSDLNNIVKVIERTLKKAFNYDKINYLMLMMEDNHIHFHVIPRYENKINFFNTEWVDEGWPKLPILTGHKIGSASLETIHKWLKDYLTIDY